MAEAAIPQIALGKATIAMADVMNGKEEVDVRHLDGLRAMGMYTVKGGYKLPVENP